MPYGNKNVILLGKIIIRNVTVSVCNARSTHLTSRVTLLQHLSNAKVHPGPIYQCSIIGSVHTAVRPSVWRISGSIPSRLLTLILQEGQLLTLPSQTESAPAVMEERSTGHFLFGALLAGSQVLKCSGKPL